MKYTVIDSTTGKILRTGDCPPSAVAAQACYPGNVVIEGAYSHRTHYWGGTEMVPFPAKPSPTYVWDWTSKTWLANLPAARAARWEQMKACRRAAAEALLVTPYGTFDADADARQNIIQTAHLMQTAAQALQPGAVPTQDFTLADNSVVTLTAGQMVEVALLLADQISAAYARGRQVRAAIDAATTVEEVEAVTWEP